MCIHPIAFSIFGIDIYWYGIAYVMGMIYGSTVSTYYLKKHSDFLHIELTEQDLIITCIMLGILLGGRIGFFVFYEPNSLWSFNEVFWGVREGGMSFHGAVIGIIIAVFLYVKIVKDECAQCFWEISDFICLVSPFGIFLGRIVNFINEDIVGRVIWGIQHPVTLYEACIEGIILCIIMNYIYPKYYQNRGKTSILFMFLYGFFRFFLDFFRDEPLLYQYLSMGQILCLIMVIMSICLYHIKKFEEN